MANKRVALFAGSFDPITIGHEAIINRACCLFDKIIIGIGKNSEKHCMLSVSRRQELIEKVFAENEKIEVVAYSGLTVDFCRQKGIKYLLRGLRSAADFEFERTIAHTNSVLDSEIETIYMLTQPEHSFISSSIVRDIYLHKGEISAFLPSCLNVEDLIE